MFDTYVCFAQPLAQPKLYNTPPPGATFLSYENCGLGVCSAWSMSTPAGDWLEWFVTRQTPYLLAGYVQSTGMFQSTNYNYWNFVLKPPNPNTWVVPNGGNGKIVTECLAWPGPSQLPPP